MKPGEAWPNANANDNPVLFGQAIVFCGTATRPPDQAWIAMVVTGPRGEQGDAGPQGPQGVQGVQGVRGAKWWWSGQAPPPLPAILGATTGDMILCLLADPAAPGHGDVYDVVNPTIDAVRAGNIRGPAGPQGEKGDPGDVSWMDLFPIVARIDALQARVDKLESFQVQTMAADVPLRDFTDEQFLTVVLPPGGEYSGSAHLTFELENTQAAIRKVTAWLDVIGDAVVTGPGSGHVTLHQALPYATLDIGPVRLVAGSGAANAVLHVQADPIGGGPYTGQVICKASTSVIPGGATAKPRATGIIAR